MTDRTAFTGRSLGRRKMGRRSLLGATATGIVAAGVPLRYARAAQFSYKYGSNLPVSHPLNKRMQEAADRVRKETNGQVEIQIFPNNQLGADTDMLSQVRSGALEFFTLSGLILQTLVPVAGINGVGFAFKDYSQVWPTMDGQLGVYVRNAIGKAGLIAFERIFDNGFRQTTTSTHPIAVPADFHGLKIRVPVSPLWTSLFKDLGAAPASINFAEVYSALQTHVVDAQENPLAIISTAKLYEVQKFCSLTNHMWDGFWMLANPRAFNALPKDAQAIVRAAINDAALAERKDVEQLNANLEGELKSKGMAFNNPETVPFRDALRKAGFYAEWKKKFGPEAWGLLEKGVGTLA